VSSDSVELAHRLVSEARAALTSGVDDAAAADSELLELLVACAAMGRQLDQMVVATIAALKRSGVFAERGYRSAVAALADLLGWERFEARRRVIVAEHVIPQVGPDGEVVPARLPATAAVFADGRTGLRHVEVIARVLASPPAARLRPEVWIEAEQDLAAKSEVHTPSELQAWGMALVELLDQRAEPGERDPEPVNELRLIPLPHGGGRIIGRFEDAATFDAIASVIDAKAAPLTADDRRGAAQRQADALAEVCGFVLDHANLRAVGGQRPHLNVLVRLDDLEERCRSGLVDFGGPMSPGSLRQMACDAAVIPVVLGGEGQPLDIGRITRSVPDGLRRAVAARGRGCEHPGCGRPPSWCEVHHVVPWQHGGETAIHNLVMLCRVHHRLVHHSDWVIRFREGLPEFIPPAWIDPERRPRAAPRPHAIV
jgi:hypothetical protein